MWQTGFKLNMNKILSKHTWTKNHEEYPKWKVKNKCDLISVDDTGMKKDPTNGQHE